MRRLSSLLLLGAIGCIVQAPAGEESAPRALEFRETAPAPVAGPVDSDAQVVTGVVVAIADGDTLTILDGTKTQHKIRLEGIDTPEKGQAFGTRAREALGEKLHEQSVRIAWKERDRYGRTLGHVYFNERWINQEMIAEGWAWHYKEYNRDPRLADAETEARAAKRGLWADPDPVAPWEYRRRQRQPQPTETAPDETLVYVTGSGAKYHRQDCRHLGATVKALPLSEAKARYQPCKGCNPPQ